MTILICKRNEKKELIVEMRYLCGNLEQANKDYPNADLIIEAEGFQGDKVSEHTKEITPAPIPDPDPMDLREKAYNQIDRELLEAIAEKEAGDDTKMRAYLVKRKAIKQRFPKPDAATKPTTPSKPERKK